MKNTQEQMNNWLEMEQIGANVKQVNRKNLTEWLTG